MPLQPNQQNYIKSITSHFFADLPTEEKALGNVIDDFKLAWRNELPDDHELIDFQMCIHHPTFHLRRVEDNHLNITIGEVQRYLFNYTKRMLENAAKKAGASFSKFDYKASELLETVKQHDRYNLPFRSSTMFISRTTTIAPPGRMFHATFTFASWHGQTQDFIITVHLKPPITKEGSCSSLNMEGRAESEAQRIIMKTLQEWLRSEQIQLSFSAERLLTYEFYYHYLTENKEILRSLSAITPVQFETLTLPSVMDFIRKKEFSIQKVFNLTPAEIKLLENPFYFSELSVGHYHFDRDFSGLSDAVGVNLTYPPIIHLLRENKISLSAAKEMSVPARSILAVEFYFNLIKKDLMDFTLIQKADENFAEDMRDPVMQDLISREIVNPNQLTPHIARLLVKNSFVRHFVESELLKITELAFFPEDESSTSLVARRLKRFSFFERPQLRSSLISFIKYAKHDLLDKFVLQTIYKQMADLSLEEKNPARNNVNIFLHDELFELCKLRVIMRLQALMSDRPLVLTDGNRDSYARLSKSCEICRVDFREILNKEIEMCLHHSQSNFLEPLMAEPELGLTNLHIQALKLGQRFFAVYRPISCSNNSSSSHKNESFELLKIELRTVAARENLPDLRNAVIRRFLQLLRDDCSVNSERYDDNISRFFKKIRHEIECAEKAELEQKGETAQLACWGKAFDHVIVIAENTKSVSCYNGYLSLNGERNSKRQCTSAFFVTQSSVSSSISIQQICERIIQIGEIRFAGELLCEGGKKRRR